MIARELVIGETLNNDELMDVFKCSSQGGMRRSKRTNSLVLISDQTKVYRDKWQGNVLHYTGMGLIGDQDFFYRQNRTLYESNTNGVDVYLFEVRQPKEYTFCGCVKLAAMPYTSEQVDAEGTVRKVCMFPVERR